MWLEIVGLRPKHLEFSGFNVSRAPIWRRAFLKGILRLSNRLLVVSWLVVMFHHSWKDNSFLLQWHITFQALWVP